MRRWWCTAFHTAMSVPDFPFYPTPSVPILVMTSSYSSSVRSSVIPTLQSAASTLHRSPILSPPPYNHPNTATHQGTVVPYAGQNAQVHGGIDHSAGTGGPSYTVHAYCLKEYAYVFVNSHADSPQDTPVIYGGEETTGTVQLPRCRLQEVQSIVVVLCAFDSDPTKPTYKTKVVLLSGQIDPSHNVNEEFSGPFVIPPPTTTAPDGDLKFELQITIHRCGCFTRKLRMKQRIRYLTRPDPSILSPLPQTLARNPRNLPSSWRANDYPGVIVKGVIFQQKQVEVECKLAIPVSYPVCDKIPLRLDMTCADRVALDLLSVSDVINVQLLQVLAFGRKAATASPPFNLRNRKSYHITKWVATAHWHADCEDKELPPDDEHRGSHWLSKLNGELRREPCTEMSHSFAEPGMAVMYYVCLFPFHAPDFRPTSNLDKVLFYGKILLSE